MRKLIQIQLTSAVQFEQPLGVQKIVSVKVGPVHKAELHEMPNGDVELHVVGSKYNHLHLIHRESIVQKLYEQEMLAEVHELSDKAKERMAESLAISEALNKEHPALGPIALDKPKPEHWKTKQKREAAEAAAKAGS